LDRTYITKQSELSAIVLVLNLSAFFFCFAVSFQPSDTPSSPGSCAFQHPGKTQTSNCVRTQNLVFGTLDPSKSIWNGRVSSTRNVVGL
jgi:hypothetical protein